MAKKYTVTGADISLFHIAARVMGDPLQWHRLAKLNRLDDPMISGTMNLLVPDPDPSTTGGVPQLTTT